MKKIVFFILISIINILPQQIIGSFPSMDGGFEGQANGSTSVVSSIAGSDTRTDWTNQGGTPTNSGTINNSGGRSGPKYVTFSFTSTGSHRRLQSPTTTGISASTSYIIQFYYRNNGGTTLDIRGGVSQSGTLPSAYASYDVDANVGTVWTKYAKNASTNSTTAANGIGIVSVLPDAIGGFDIDDFCIYQGTTPDNTAPNSPTSPSAVQTSNPNELLVSWTAPIGGVDGGGYLVIRRTSSGTPTPPNVNGIYAIGNSIGDGNVAYIGTSTSFTDLGLDNSITYYYTIYAVDKAFNYSTGTTADGANPLPVELTSFTATLAKKNIILNWKTQTEVNNYGFEIERASTSLNTPDSTFNGQVQKDNWKKIGFVAGSGNSNSPKEYSFVDNTITKSGKYAYRLKQIDTDGTFNYSNEVEVDFSLLDKFSLEQNYPNPFNPTTVISYQIPVNSNVSLKVYNVLGREIATLVDEYKEAGRYEVEFNLAQTISLSSGVYFYKLQAGDFVETKKMLLVR